MSSPIDGIKELERGEREAAREATIGQVKRRLVAPDVATYLSGTISAYPAWLTRGMTGFLLVVAVGALVISAGKLITATDVVLSPAVRESSRLSATWQDASIAFMLAMGEFGAIVFFAAASVFSRGSRTRAIIFRVIGTAFALGALIANVSVTAQHYIPAYLIFNWFVAMLPPIVVLGVGYLGESMLLSTLEERRVAVEKYEAHKAEYDRYMADPESHPKFFGWFCITLYEALKAKSNGNKQRILILEQQYPREGKLWLVRRELDKERGSWEDANTIETPAETVKQLGTVRNLVIPPSVNSKVVSPDGLVLTASQPVSPVSGEKSPRERAKELLVQKPELANLRLMELEMRTGISKATWSRALKERSVAEVSSESLEEAAK